VLPIRLSPLDALSPHRHLVGACAFALVLGAVVLPVEGLARALVVDPLLQERLVLGGRILQGLLVLHAALLLGSLRLAVPRAAPLVEAPAEAVAADEAGGAAGADGLGARERLFVVLLVLAGFGLRLFALGDGLWFDEIDTLTKVLRRPWGELLGVFDSQNHHLLYSLLARLGLDAGFETHVAIRLPAAVFGALSLGAAYTFARRLTDRIEAGAVALFLFCAYHHVWFSQNARGYTGLLLFTLLGSSAFVDALTRAPSWRPVLRYGVWMALACLLHATAAIVVAAHGLVWLVLAFGTRRRAAGRFWPGWAFVFATSFTLLAYALVLPQFVDTLLAPTMPGKETEWKDPLWLARETLGSLAASLPGGWLGLGAGLSVGALGLVAWFRRGWVFVGILLLPAVLTATAIVALNHNLWPRFFFSSAAFLVLVPVRGFGFGAELVLRKSGRAVAIARVVMAALVVGAAATTLPAAFGPKQDFPGALEHVEAARAPGDVVATVDMAQMPYDLYLRTDWVPVDTEAELEALERLPGATWVVLTMPTKLAADFPDVWARLESRYEEAGRFPGTVRGGDVVVLTSSETNAPR